MRERKTRPKQVRVKETPRVVLACNSKSLRFDESSLSDWSLQKNAQKFVCVERDKTNVRRSHVGECLDKVCLCQLFSLREHRE